jgi:RNA polymerase sigma-70 factor (ECF subfamily)
MGSTPAPDTETEAHEFEQALNTAVLSLPERTQIVLSLRWRDGLTYKQIAQVLGMSAAAAEKQGQRAEQALRALLQRFGQ